jgi:hypothetical protein
MLRKNNHATAGCDIIEDANEDDHPFDGCKSFN